MLLTLLAAPLWAQEYRFPAADAHYGYFYPTAYVDHGGVDWGCGGITYSGHRGSDFGGGSWSGMDAGRDIVAAAVGVVIETHDGEYDRCDSGDCGGGGGYGNYVKVLHPDGKETTYAHFKQWSVAVGAGQFVECGQKLGQMGSSGNSTGPHVHFQVEAMDGSAHDPFWGGCSGAPSYWVDQGGYGGLPGAGCDGSIAACPVAALITCGASFSATNGDMGSSAHGWYGGTTWVYSGPEIGYHVQTDRDEPVTVSLGGMSGDLDLYVLASDQCQGRDVVGYSDNGNADGESVTFNAAAGATYTIVIDGYEGAVSAFALSVGCAGGLPVAEDPPEEEPVPEEPVDSGDPAPVIDPPPVDEIIDPPPVLEHRDYLDEGAAGRGCQHAAGFGGMGLAALAALRRRKR